MDILYGVATFLLVGSAVGIACLFFFFDQSMRKNPSKPDSSNESDDEIDSHLH